MSSSYVESVQEVEAQWQALVDTGLGQMERGEWQAAETFFQQAVEMASGFGSNDLRMAESLNLLGLAYTRLLNFVEAEPLLRRAMSIRETALGGDHPYVAESFGNLARLYLAQGKTAKADAVARESLALFQQCLDPNHPAIADGMTLLGDIAYELGRPTEAAGFYEQAFQIREAALGLHHPQTAGSLRDLMQLYKAIGDVEKMDVYAHQLKTVEEVRYLASLLMLSADAEGIAESETQDELPVFTESEVLAETEPHELTTVQTVSIPAPLETDISLVQTLSEEELEKRPLHNRLKRRIVGFTLHQAAVSPRRRWGLSSRILPRGHS